MAARNQAERSVVCAKLARIKGVRVDLMDDGVFQCTVEQNADPNAEVEIDRIGRDHGLLFIKGNSGLRIHTLAPEVKHATIKPCVAI